MTIEEVINKAIEGGYPKARVIPYEGSKMLISEAILDASFWIALSSRLGWEGKCWKCECGYRAEYFSKNDHQFCSRDGKKLSLSDDQRGEWNRYWHSFIDHLAYGESAESFFETLS